MHKLGVIVPYRDRYDQLLDFKKGITEYLKFKKIDFELIVVEQDNAKAFNRGKLLNIGFKYAKKLKCNYVVFHDVDMLPLAVDYCYCDYPVHLASERAVFDEYFGGVTMFPVEHFEKINGYSNDYWGWGFEDDDLLYRCKVNNLPLNKKEIKVISSHTAALAFNGHNAYVESSYKANSESTIFVTFEPKDLVLNHESYDDEFVVFSLPKFKLRVAYDSYSKYKVVVEDFYEKLLYVSSNKKPAYKTTLCLTLGDSTIKLYQDGELIGETKYQELNDNRNRAFYLGKNFKGLIHSFALYDRVLNEDEIKEIFENKHFGLTYFNSADSLKTYYEAAFTKNYELVDLSGNNNRGKIYDCEIVPCTIESSKFVDIPFRKQSKFKLLEHEDNGFVGGGWKNITTRYNQLRFTNEVAKGFTDNQKDGLSTLKYKEYSYVTVDKETHIVVGI